MTDLDLDAINSWCGLSAYCDWVAATDDARSEPCDVHRVVAALREARTEAARWERAAIDAASEIEARWNGLDRQALEAERDDWRRRYEALRDGVLGLHVKATQYTSASSDNTHVPLTADYCVHCGPLMWPCATAAVVARVEGDQL